MRVEVIYCDGQKHGTLRAWSRWFERYGYTKLVLRLYNINLQLSLAYTSRIRRNYHVRRAIKSIRVQRLSGGIHLTNVDLINEVTGNSPEPHTKLQESSRSASVILTQKPP